MRAESWMPKDLNVKRIEVVLAMVDVRTRGEKIERFIPATFDARATVQIGLDGNGDAIWKDIYASAASIEEALTDLWQIAKATRLDKL